MRMKTEHEALAMGGTWDDSESTSKRLNRKDASQVFPSGNDCILELLDCGLAVETVRFSAVLR